VINNYEMKRSLNFLCLFFLFGMGNFAIGQSGKKNKSKKSDLGIDVSAAIRLPVGNFNSTHLIGVGLDISPSYRTVRLERKIKIAFTYNVGMAYYLGKKVKPGGYQYRYPSYIFLHAFAGILLIPSKNGGMTFPSKIEISLTGGPALGIYNGDTRFNPGSKLELNYRLNGHVTIGPGIILIKESGADPLWAASIKATLAF
jgi:hypothetical protein